MSEEVKISSIFRPASGSLYETFMSHNGNASFSIPLYQRKYDWGKDNIVRMFEDVVNGLYAYGEDDSALTFFGAIILVEDGKKKEEGFEGESLSVVDGQQRLTTISLIVCSMIEALNITKNRCNIENAHIRDWVYKEVDTLTDSLFGCILGSASRRRPRNPSKYDFFPRIVRTGRYLDFRASDNRANYNSNIGYFLHEFGDYVNANEDLDEPFNYEPRKNDDDSKAFINNLDIIKATLSAVSTVSGNWGEIFPSAAHLLGKQYNALFKELSFLEDKISLRSVKDKLDDNLSCLVRLIVLGNYFIDKAALTRVEVADQRYAFEIFEALNTTGEPLTAIETFKPLVIRYEEDASGYYENTKSAERFAEIEEILNKYRHAKKRQSESKDTILSFALYLTGEKQPATPSLQRKYLRSEYDRVKGEKNEHELREKFVSYMAHILDYRDRFWDTGNIHKQLIGGQDELLIFLRFFKDIKSSLTVPILSRFYVESIEHDDPEIFRKAVQALAAFVIIRRSATGGTKGIDTDLRDIMNKGGRTHNSPQLPLKRWVKKDRRLHKVIEKVPSIKDFQAILISYLEKRSLGLVNDQGKLDKGCWKAYFTNLSIYQHNVLAKICLFLAYNNSIEDEKNPGLLIKARNNPQELNYLTLNAWGAQAYETIEHVAPQNPENKSSWDAEILKEPEIAINCIGNLALLPLNENNEVANSDWNVKRWFYRAFSARSNTELEAIFESARKDGCDFKKKTKLYLKESAQCLPSVSCLSNVDDWSRGFIRERASNMGDLVWSELSDYLDL